MDRLLPDSLTLPEPAAGLFARTQNTLYALLTPLAAPRGWWIGGGSVLAAQWGHRESTDLDLFLPSNRSVAPLDPRWDDSFVKAMTDVGAQAFNVQPSSIKVAFPSGRLEVTALDPVPLLPPRDVIVDGRPALVLRNASIMTGKLFGRGFRLPVRDVFDICVASVADPAALRCAVNHITPEARLELAHLLLHSADKYRADAPEQILRPAPQYAHFMQDGPEVAAEVVVRETYEDGYDLQFLGRDATVTARTTGGMDVSYTCRSGDELAEAMRGMGLETAMLGSAGSVEAFVAEADQRLSEARPGGSGGPTP